MQSTEKVLESMYNKLDNFLKTETVVGETIEVGELKLIPIITASFGLGGGIGEEDNTGGGGGEVEMMPVKNKNSLEKLIEKVPSLIEKIEETKNKKDKELDKNKSEAKTEE